MKWAALILASLVVLVLGLSAIDKYDERTCKQTTADYRRSSCDGFLPW